MTTSFHRDPPGSQKSVVTNHCTSPEVDCGGIPQRGKLQSNVESQTRTLWQDTYDDEKLDGMMAATDQLLLNGEGWCWR